MFSIVRFSGKISALSILLGLLINNISVAAEPPELLKNLRQEKLAIVLSDSNQALFTVYLAETSAQRSRGLMFVRLLEETEGMLFLYKNPEQISMWMKNTYIPLDMVFIDADMTISSIHENATPHSTAIIDSSKKVSAVLELAGGSAKRLGINAGDQVIYPATQ